MNNKLRAAFLLMILSLIWGSSFLLMKKGLIVFSPVQLACLRITIAGLVLAPIAIMNLNKVNKKEMLAIIAFSICNGVLPAILFPMAQTRVDSSTVGILNALSPVFTLIVGVMLFHISFNFMKLVGVLLGLSGACLIILYPADFSRPATLEGGHVSYTMLAVLGTVCYGFSSNILKNYLQNVPGHVISALAYGIFAIPMGTWLFTTDFIQKVDIHPDAAFSLLNIIILAVVGSAVAIALYSKLVQMSNALFGSFVTYLMPFVAIAWGWLDNEKIGVVPLVGLAIIIIGIYLATFVKPRHTTTNSQYPARRSSV
ncbi:MAG: DMT family transporter [Bacteroidota bacterium]|nr:DMT family transporter [Bacteroidota bacterium]